MVEKQQTFFSYVCHTQLKTGLYVAKENPALHEKLNHANIISNANKSGILSTFRVHVDAEKWMESHGCCVFTNNVLSLVNSSDANTY